MIKRLPRYAELTFARACALAGAVAQSPDEDQYGWDYLVEFADRPRPGHADLHPPAPKAFAQVKSTEKAHRSCRIKLSNALRAARSNDPWFIILMIAGNNGAVSLYAKHFDDELIAMSLKAVRQATRNGRDLRKYYLTLQFGEGDARKEYDLVPWMEQCIDRWSPNYSFEKRRLSETVGFEGGVAIGSLTITANNEDEIFDGFLGLGDGLQVDKFTITPTRFGIDDEAPSLSLESGTVHFMPDPAGKCELRFRGPDQSTTISIPADVYVLPPGMVGADERRFRFSGRGVELIWSMSGHSKFTFKIDPQARYSISDIHNVSTLFEWSRVGPIDAQVWAFGGRAIAATLNFGHKNQGSDDWKRFTQVTALLNTVAGSKESGAAIAITMADIDRGAHDLYLMAQLIGSPSLMMEFVPSAPFPKDVVIAIYYAVAAVGDFVAFATIQRDVVRVEDLDAGKKRVVLGTGKIRENWIVKSEKAAGSNLAAGDYNRIVAQLEEAGTPPLQIGDILVAHAIGKAERT